MIIFSNLIQTSKHSFQYSVSFNLAYSGYKFMVMIKKHMAFRFVTAPAFDMCFLKKTASNDFKSNVTSLMYS